VLLSFVKNHKSILAAVCRDDLPDFVVIVGPNGAGKSHLFEAILNGSVSIDGINSAQHGNDNEIKLFELGQLVPNSGGEQQPMQFKDVWGRIKPTVLATAQQWGYPQTDESLRRNADNFTAQVSNNLNLPRLVIENAQTSAGKLLPFFSNSDYRDHFPLYQSAQDLFQYSVTDIFLTYFEKWRNNKFNKFLNLHDGVATATWIDDEIFIGKYGRAPWIVLDEVLDTMGLAYRFEEPVDLPPDVPYQPKLVAMDTGTTVSLETLSSGEKVLLALALGLYAGQHMANTVRKPKLLLLDEADASLHPSMIRSLLTVTQNVLCAEHGVKILLATHSPTTVALAPESGIYSLARTGDPRMTKVSRERALSQLTVGIPTLSVKVDDRRQVFVESEYDERYYDLLYRSLRPRIDSPYTLNFISSGSGRSGGCGAVINLVTALRAKGNTAVLGVVDRDNRRGAPEHIDFMAERYSIENFLLDPLLLGAFLIRERVRSSDQLGLPAGVRHFEITETNSQALIDAVEDAIWSGSNGDEPSQLTGRGQVSYAGGFEAHVSERHFSTPGHSLEAHIKDIFKELNAYRDLQLEVCKTIVVDSPQLVPRAIIDLFGRLTGVPN
jgi:predicted ATPase